MKLQSTLRRLARIRAGSVEKFATTELGERPMTRFTRLALALGACGCLVASLTVRAQEPGGGRGAARGRGRGQAMTLPDGSGKATVESACGSCHGLNVITG